MQGWEGLFTPFPSLRSFGSILYKVLEGQGLRLSQPLTERRGSGRALDKESKRDVSLGSALPDMWPDEVLLTLWPPCLHL